MQLLTNANHLAADRFARISRDHGSFLATLSSTLGQFQAPAPQIAVRSAALSHFDHDGYLRSVGKQLRRLVELVGLEPTTSSLRTMRSPN
jgi:hypothetical protein